MKTKSKIGAIVCSAALCSMIAIPAFAADPVHTEENIDNETTRKPLDSDMYINATVTNSTEVIKMTVPTQIPLIVQTYASDTTVGADIFKKGAFKTYVAPQNITIKNYSFDRANSNLGFAVSVGIKTVQDTSNLLNDVNIYVGATSDTSGVELKTAKDVTDPVTLFSSIAARADENNPGTQAMKLHVTDNKNKLELANDDSIVAVKTVLHIAKA